MPLTNAVPVWTLQMPAGSLEQWTFTFTYPTTGQPFPITGATWEYVVRTSASATGSPLIQIGTTATANGLIAVTAAPSLSQVLLDIYPAATSSLTATTYYHALWMNPGALSALCIFSGALIVTAAPQP